jgi:hypothetical protein
MFPIAFLKRTNVTDNLHQQITRGSQGIMEGIIIIILVEDAMIKNLVELQVQMLARKPKDFLNLKSKGHQLLFLGEVDHSKKVLIKPIH